MTGQPKPVPPRVQATPGRCETGRPVCGKTARLYPGGWRCERHQPAATHTA